VLLANVTKQNTDN